MTDRRIAVAAFLIVLATAGRGSAQTINVRTVEDRNHVTVMEFGGIYDRQPEANRAYEQAVREAVAKEFFRTHADEYDFLVTFTRFPYALGTDTDGSVGGRYYQIKNDIAGIGLDQFDFSAQFGSSGTLQGYIDMGVLSRLASDPTDPRFESTLSVLAHEMMHRWGAHVRFRDSDGSFSTALLGRDAAHWSALVNSYNSVLYGHEWRDNGDGTFTSIGRSRTFYSPLDLYVMGILDRTQVPPFFIIDSEDIDPASVPEVGVTIHGTKKTVTIDDVIAAEGERMPAAADAPKRFKMAFVFLVRPGEDVDGVELAAINAIRDAFTTRALILTGGEAVVEVFPEPPAAPIAPPEPILPPSSGPRSGPLNLVQALDWLLVRQRADGSWADSMSTRVRDSAAVFELLREVPAAFGAYQDGLAWLTQLQEQQNVDMTSRRLLAIRPQFSAPDTAFLNAARNPGGGWGLGPGYRSDALDSALALLATPASTADDLAFIVGAQNVDGGWSLRPGTASSVQTTIAVLELADRYAGNAALGAALGRGVAWLQGRQNSDGGFGEHGSTIYDTAQAVLHLLDTSFPKAQIALALDYLRQRQQADGSWNESSFETALAIRALKTGQLPNALVIPGSVTFSAAAPIDGEPVTVSATIANESVTDIGALVVSLFDGDPAAGGTQIGADLAIGALPALTQVPVSFVWNTTGRAGTHTLFIVVDRLNQVDEFDEADNQGAAPLTVRPPPVEPDLSVSQASLAFLPTALEALPQDQTLTAVISNAGQTSVSDVAVWVYEGDPALQKKVAEAVVSVAGRGSASVIFSFRIDAPGEHPYFVVVDPTGQVLEADETNNRASRVLPVHGTHDFLVSPGTLTLSASPIPLGHDLTIAAEVLNRGTTDAFAVPVRIYIDDPGGPIDVATQTLNLPAGASAPVNAVWRTSRPLNGVPVVVHVDPLNGFPENSESDNQSSVPLTVSSSTDANLRVTHVDLAITSPVLQGGAATISIPVHNNGFADAVDVAVDFYVGVPGQGGVQIGQRQTIASLPLGSQATASVLWNSITGFGDKLIYVVVDPAGAVAEFDEQDNTAFITTDVLSLPDLAVSSASLSFAPAFPRPGDSIAIDVSVGNLGEQAAANVSVRFFQGDPASGGVAIGAEQIVHIPAHGHANAQVAYEAGADGASTVFVAVDALNQIAELNEANNAASRTLGVQNASVFVSDLYFSPNGDEVQDETTFFFRAVLGSAASVQVLDRDGQEVRFYALTPGSSSDSVAWDGTDYLDRVVPDGEYTFAVNGNDGVELASATVVVDNNNSPVGDAAGTKYLVQNNLTCDATGANSGAQFANVSPNFEHVGWLPDDTGLVSWVPTQMLCPAGHFYYFRCAFQYVSSPQVGVYITSPDGQRARITPDSWTGNAYAASGTQIGFVAPSPDGRKILIGLRRSRTVFDVPGWIPLLQYFGPAELWVVNSDGSGLAQIASLPRGLRNDPIDLPIAKWSPDGRYVSVQDADTVSSETHFFTIDMADGRQTPIRSMPFDGSGGWLTEVGWSRNGQRLVYQHQGPPPAYKVDLHAVNPDGTNPLVLPRRDDVSLANAIWIGPDRFVNQIYDYDTQTSRLFMFFLDGAAPVVLAPDVQGIREAVLAPGGNAIVFSDNVVANWPVIPEQGSTGIWRVDAEGNVERLYTASIQNQGISSLSWTRDARRIAFYESVITDFRTCDGEGGPDTDFCGDVSAFVGTVDVADRSVRVVVADAYTVQVIGFFPDGNSFLAVDGTGLIALSLEDGRRTTLFQDDRMAIGFPSFGFTPSGKYFIFHSQRESRAGEACYKGGFGFYDTFVMGSLLNLSTDLSFQRDRSQLLLRGTAEDRNFASYTLEAALASQPDQWAPIAPPSDSSVIGGPLASWVPPSEGTFIVRLTATDLAGNREIVRKRVTWGLTPTITNVTVAPRTFSPNGDGAKDSVTVSYVVLGPVNLVFTIFGAQDTPVRTILQAHPVIGPASIAWDGRNDAGQVVPDGIYRVHVLDYDFFVTVDTTPPDVRLALGGAFRTVPQKVACLQTSTGLRCTTFPGPVVDTPSHTLIGRAYDASLAAWRLDVSNALTPSEWVLVSQGTDVLAARDGLNRPIIPIADTTVRTLPDVRDVTGKRYRLTATDQAGNLRTMVTDLAPQELILHAWDGVPVPTMRTLEQALGPHVLSVAHTIRAAQRVTLQYRLDGSTIWVDGAELLTPAGQFELPWNNAALAGGKTYDVRLLGRDADEGEYFSNALSIHSDLFKFTAVDTSLFPKVTTTTGVASLSEPLTDIRLVLAVEGDPDIGLSAAVYSDPVTFSIVVAPDPSLDGCARLSVPARYKGTGDSGRVYYSDTRAVTRFGPPGKTCSSTTRGALLELSVTRVMPADCSLPNPERVQIRLRGTPGVRAGTVHLLLQDVPNGLLQEVPGVSLPFDRDLDTTPLVEGTYFLRATAEAEASAGGGLLAASASFVVDHTPPSPQITYPAANQLLCPSRAGERAIVTVEGVAEDANFDHYSVEYAVGERGAHDAGVAWMPVFRSPADAVASQSPKRGVLAEWDVTGLAAGVYTLRLTVFDKGGNAHCVTTTFTLQGGLSLDGVRTDSPFVSPNGDGDLDSVGVDFMLSAPALVDARVFAVTNGVRAQTPLRTLLTGAQHLSGSNTILWDGLNDLGVAVPDGVYHVVLTALDACGFPVSRFAVVEVDSTPPEALMTSPLPGALSRVSVEVRGSVSDLHFSSYRLEVGEGAAPSAWTVIATGRAPVVSGLLGTWNTRAVAGDYTLRLTATDAAGNSREVLTFVTVTVTQPLVDSLVVQPAVFSPNGDSRLDVAFIDYVTTASARVAVDVLSGEEVVATLVPEYDVAAGAHAASWRGLMPSGAPFADGEYSVRITATSTADGRVQTEASTVIVDTTAPVLAVATPAAAAQMRGDVEVIGTVADAHIDAYTVSYGTAAAGPTVILGEGGQSRTDHLFSTLRGLSDGAYSIRITASDKAGNTALLDRPFAIDNESPTVALLSPETGAIAGGGTPVLDVRGAVAEANLQEWSLRVGAGLDPAQWTTIVAQPTPPASEHLALWDTTGLADGVYTLSLQAVDRAGAAADARVQVVVDHTEPEAAIRQPADGGRVSGPFEIRGDASDGNFKSAILELSEGTAATAARFTPLTTIEEPVTDGLLFPMGTPPPDATYTLRLTVEDDAGQRTVRLVTFVVDTQPPSPPSNLAAALENGNRARLTWVAPAGETNAGYNLYRGERKLNTSPIPATTYLDQNLTDGIHRYTVTVVDAGNLESARSNEAGVAVDLTPPAVQIQSPLNGAIVGDLVNVRGTAASADDFAEYRLFVGEGAAPASFTLIRQSHAPVTSSLITQWDTTALPQGAVRTLRLEADDLRGNTAVAQVTVTIDNQGPAAPVLLSVTQTGTSLTATWQASPDPDLAGYLLFHGDVLANLDRPTGGNLTPYLIQGTSFADTGLLDGMHTYVVVAVDRGGNQSPPSNAVEALLETRAPRATIVQPASGITVDAPVTLVATSPDTDIASVQFQYRPTNTAVWTNLGALVTAPPFTVEWDPRPLPLPPPGTASQYRFRAVGTDVRGNTDTVPETIPPMVQIFYRDVTKPAPPTNLSAVVTAGTVSLSWTASPTTDVQWYYVFRQKGGGSPEFVNQVPAGVTSYNDADRVDGLYTYHVEAVDTASNESAPSASVLAHVYSLQLDTPALCLAEPVTAIQGTGAPGGATVTLFTGDGPGAAIVATAQADLDGGFEFTGVALQAGPNVFTAEAVDLSGNRSKRARSLTVAYETLPGALPSLDANVVDHDVHLSWTPAAAAAGYGVYRDGVRIGPSADVTSRGVVTASSEYLDNVATNATDGDLNTFWLSDWTHDPEPWWQLRFPATVHVREVRVLFTFGAYASDFQIQRWDGNAWVAIAAVTDNTESERLIALDSPVPADRLRIVITGAPFDLVFVGEVQVMAGGAVIGTTFTDASQPDARYVYAVRGSSACGLEGPAREVEVAVGDVTPPAAPTGVTATAIGSTAHLAWTPNVEADVAGYHVYRRTADGNWPRLTPAPIATAAFMDPLLQNGAYRYRVTAVDAIGNQSEPSAEAEAIVAVAKPSAPTSLIVSAPPVGGALDLSWAAPATGPPVQAYVIYRALSSGGPYEALMDPDDPGEMLLVGAAAWRDVTVSNGVTYFYVVRAADATLNQSDPSNEASGTPADMTAPAPPDILAPTDAAHPISITTDTVVVSGLAEPASNVTLLRDGIELGLSTATNEAVLEQFSLDAEDDSDAVVHPSGLVAMFVERPGSFDVALAVTNVRTQQTRFYVQNGDSIAFMPDGSQILYSRFGNNGPELDVLDLASGSIVRTVSLDGYPQEFAVSPDGTRVAVAVYDPNSGGYALWLVTLATGAIEELTADSGYISHTRWSPDGGSIVYSVDSNLNRITLADHTVQLIDVDFNGDVTFSPDGNTLAYTVFRDDRTSVLLRNLGSGAVAPLPPAEPGRVVEEQRWPVFSADGAFIVTVERPAGSNDDEVWRRRLGTTEADLVLADPPDDPFWMADRSIVFVDDVEITRLVPPGSFAFTGVAIEPGVNRFSAIAVDASGNTSAPADPISLTRSTAGFSDLVVRPEDVFVYPLLPAPGEQVRITATIRNAGSVAAPGVSVTFFDIDEQGTATVVGSLQSIGTIAAGAQATATDYWHASVGRHRLQVWVDPLGVVSEVSEANNRADRAIDVALPGTPAVFVAVDQPAYTATDTVRVSVTAVNPTADATFILDVTIEDPQGQVAASVLHETLTPFSYGKRDVDAAWPADGSLAGDYRARATLRRSDGQAVTATAPFSVLPDEHVVLGLSTDRAAYADGDGVRVAGVVRNTSSNVDLSNVSASIDILKADGTAVQQSETTLGTLLIGTQASPSAIWQATPPGGYTARLTARQGTRVLGQMTRPFTVTGTARVGAALSVARSAVPGGDDFAVSAALTNTGSLGVSGLTARLRLLDPGTQTTIRSYERVVDLPAGASLSWPLEVSSVGLAIKSYTLVLGVERPGPVVETLATATAGVSVLDLGAPVVHIVTPAPDQYGNHAVTIVARVTDELSPVTRVELRIDSGGWLQMAPADPAAGTFSFLLGASASTEGVHTIAVRAMDGAGNGESTSSTDANPVTLPLTIDITAPAIVVSGVADGQSYQAAVTPEIAVTDAALVTTTIQLDGAPFTSGATVGASGPHTLTVVAVDRAGNTSNATVHFTLAVGGPPIAASQSITTAEDVSVAIVLGASDPDGEPLTFAVTTPAHGTLSGAAPNLTYAPAPNFHGTDQFTFTARDATTTSNSATVAIQVTPVNDRPTAGASAAPSVPERTTVALDGSSSADVDGNPLTYRWTQVSGPTAVLDVSDPVHPTFVAPDVAAGGDTLVFELVVNDGALDSAPSRVSIDVTSVNRPPTSSDQSVTTAEDTAAAILLGAVDPDGDPLTFVATVPAHGTLSGTGPNLTYTPAANYHGADQFTFTASDAATTSNSATITIQVTPVNDRPTANPGVGQSVDEGAPVVLDGAGSSDVDGDALTYRWSQVAGVPAVLDLSNPARPFFTAPEVSRNGSTLSFELIVNDGSLDSAPAHVAIVVANVNRRPHMENQSLTTNEDTPVSWTLAVADPDEDPLTFEIQAPNHGAVTGIPPNLTYTPVADFHGADQFTVVVRDLAGLDAHATVTIAVISVNDAPVARAGADATAFEGETVTLDGSGSRDADGDALSFAWTQAAGPAVVLHGADTPTPSFGAPDVPIGGSTLTFRLVVSDTEKHSEPAYVNITVKNVNHAPVADAGTAQRVGGGVPVSLDGSLSYDPDGDQLGYAWRQIAGVSVELIAPETARPSFVAPVVHPASVLTFELTVSDGIAAASDRVEVTVEPSNHAPIADAGADQQVHEEATVTLDGGGSRDADGDPLGYRWTQVQGSPVALSDYTARQPRFEAPLVGQAGEKLAFDLVVNDGLLDSAPDRVTIQVLDVKHPPVCSAAVASPSRLWPPDHKLVTVRIANLSHGDRDDPGGHAGGGSYGAGHRDDGRGDDDDRGDDGDDDRDDHDHDRGDDDRDDDRGDHDRDDHDHDRDDDLVVRIVKVTQDEPVTGTGDGDTGPDAVIDGDKVSLRAERSGKGNGRVYRITFTATGGQGGSCSGTVAVEVPHQVNKAAIDSGQNYDSTATGTGKIK